MFSRCSHCQFQLRVGAEQLRSSRGLLKCSNCGKRFDALASLSEQADTDIPRQDSFDLPPKSEAKAANIVYWGVGIALSISMLVAQVVYFEGDSLLRQPSIRIAGQAICEHLHCSVPEYKNLDEWTVSHSDFRKAPNRGYMFSAAITNQAEFSQRFPDLKLVLRDLDGQAVAERIFSGWQYASSDGLAANETAEIRLNVVAPPNIGEIGGFTIALL